MDKVACKYCKNIVEIKNNISIYLFILLYILLFIIYYIYLFIYFMNLY